MTREELKEHCLKEIEMCELWAIGKGEKPSGKIYEEHKLILELLEQEPCEDAISRKAVLNYLDKMPSELTSDGRRMVRRRTLEEYISDTLPPVNPQPKTAHWISDAIQGEIDGEIVKGFTCSKCGAISVFRMTAGKIVNGDLCANCGAKMIEPQE